MPIDLNLYLSHTNRRSIVEVLLRGHLWVEKHLIALLESELSKPERLDLDRMTFSQTVKLADALGMLHADEVGAIRILNGMRNKLAHDLSGSPSRDDVARFGQAMPKSQRELAAKLLAVLPDEEPESGDEDHELARELAAAVLALLTELEQHSQWHAYWREHRNAMEGYKTMVTIMSRLGATPETEDEYRQALGIPAPPTPRDAILSDTPGPDEDDQGN